MTSRPLHVHDHMVVRDQDFTYRYGEPIFIVEPDGSLDISGCRFSCLEWPGPDTTRIVYGQEGEDTSFWGAIICKWGSTGTTITGCHFDRA